MLTHNQHRKSSSSFKGQGVFSVALPAVLHGGLVAGRLQSQLALACARLASNRARQQ
jgi:hypothetical protein